MTKEYKENEYAPGFLGDGIKNGKIAAEKHKIICLGDSITFGFPYGPEFSWVKLVAAETGLNMINRGLNGDTTSGMLARFQRHVLSEKPGCVIIMGGTNDAWLGCLYQDIQFNLDRMVKIAIKHGIRPVIGIPVPVNFEAVVNFFGIHDLKGLSDYLETYKKWMREYAVREKINIIDFHAALANPGTGRGMGAFYSDNGHPNLDGYRKMAEQAAKTLVGMDK